MSRKAPAIVLFRRDLRVADNRALSAAVSCDKPLICLFIMDEARPGGGASRWWLHHSLSHLQDTLLEIGGNLVIRRGGSADVVDEVISDTGADAVYWNRRYHPAEASADAAMKTGLRGRGLVAESFDGMLLHEPSRLKTSTGGFYKVYTPFWKALANEPEPRDPVDAPTRIQSGGHKLLSLSLNDLDLLPSKPDWSGGLVDSWKPGEGGAQAALKAFLAEHLKGYSDSRDVPGEMGTSRLSPHLAFGEITPFQVVAALSASKAASKATGDAVKFRKELVWREFCHHLLFHNPNLHDENFRSEFDGFPWQDDPNSLRKWQRGLTGYPIVDAGMRQLWQTGWMHNRVRMVVASFLIKHLGIDWRQGERWFWDTLVDGDAASNPANWQWVAGTGADAAPYFRIFNPILQGEKFDSGGDYVRQYVPELAALPDRYLHRPWEAPDDVLRESEVTLGETYPRPIVDHRAARERALGALDELRSKEAANA
ncbi:MAG: DNA photolyase family protein [Rhizobiaceae bacterium]|nr:DNA photolyase family protein [Rhizobiaceae bacterium]